MAVRYSRNHSRQSRRTTHSPSPRSSRWQRNIVASSHTCCIAGGGRFSTKGHKHHSVAAPLGSVAVPRLGRSPVPVNTAGNSSSTLPHRWNYFADLSVSRHWPRGKAKNSSDAGGRFTRLLHARGTREREVSVLRRTPSYNVSSSAKKSKPAGDAQPTTVGQETMHLRAMWPLRTPYDLLSCGGEGFYPLLCRCSGVLQFALRPSH